MSDPTEAEMSDFVNQFVPKGTARANMWAIKKFKKTDIKAYNENELSLEFRTFYMDLKYQDGKPYTQVSLRGIRAGLQRHLRSCPNPPTLNNTNKNK